MVDIWPLSFLTVHYVTIQDYLIYINQLTHMAAIIKKLIRLKIDYYYDEVTNQLFWGYFGWLRWSSLAIGIVTNNNIKDKIMDEFKVNSKDNIKDNINNNNTNGQRRPS